MENLAPAEAPKPSMDTVRVAIIDQLESLDLEPDSIEVVEKAKDVYHATVTFVGVDGQEHGIFTRSALGL